MSSLPKIGITCGDLNGIGMEVVLKTLADPAIFDMCRPVLFTSSRSISYHRKACELGEIPYSIVSSAAETCPDKRVAVIEPWQEQPLFEFGKADSAIGTLALMSLDAGIAALKEGQIDALVTAPLNKNTIPVEGFAGHTGYIAQAFDAKPLMLLSGSTLRVALATEHVALKDVSAHLTAEKLQAKIELLTAALVQDYAIQNPRIAVLAMNPHASDNGAFGQEEQEWILPAVEALQANGKIVYGPYAADGFFGAGTYKSFDAVMALYHDQGLIPFKMAHFEDGVNVTCGLPVVRTSPDHGVAYDVAGKNCADPSSFRAALFEALDIIRRRAAHAEATLRPLEIKVKPKKDRD